jgi:hypothetical protein
MVIDDRNEQFQTIFDVLVIGETNSPSILRLTKTCMRFELKTRCFKKSGLFILLKACQTGFFHGKTASPKFQFSSFLRKMSLLNFNFNFSQKSGKMESERRAN